MDRYVCGVELDQELINGEIIIILDSFAPNYGTLDEICGYDFVETQVNKGEMPTFRKGDKKYVGCKVELGGLVSVLCPID